MNLSTLTRRAEALARRVAGSPAHALLLAAAVLVVTGVVAAVASWFGLAIIALLGVQSIVLVLLLWSRRQAAAADDALRRRLDESDRRVLGDIARSRQAVLDAIAAQREDGAR